MKAENVMRRQFAADFNVLIKLIILIKRNRDLDIKEKIKFIMSELVSWKPANNRTFSKLTFVRIST